MTDVNLRTIWNGNMKGQGNIKADYLQTNIAIPENLGGSGEGANPKEILVSSATSCYILTLVSILEIRKLPVIKLTMDSEASDSKEKGLKITHYPHITLSANTTEKEIQSAHKSLENVDKECGIGNMLKKADAQINFEGKVTIKPKK